MPHCRALPMADPRMTAAASSKAGKDIIEYTFLLKAQPAL